MPRREVVQDDHAMASCNEGVRTNRADVPGAACYQDRARLNGHGKSLRDGISPFGGDDSLAPRKEFTRVIRYAAVCDVIYEVRQECRDPWPGGAAEASDQLITTDGEIACCSRELLLVTLHTCAKQCGSRSVRPTSRDTSTDLSNCISGIARRGGSHNSERRAIKVATLSLALRDRHSTVKCAYLLDRRNGRAGSAPRFKERCHIRIIRYRQQELTHPPQWIWCIGE